jgi:hypothetical protein
MILQVAMNELLRFVYEKILIQFFPCKDINGSEM